MIPSSRYDELQQTKNEEIVPNGTSKLGNTKTVLSSSRQWSAFKDPRIVPVSRSFGGKDRHSKVCTIRGLRDRRIRLSVPTAIQLYDLQERLGLNQPSKVIDWLMDSTKDDIDMLPPLQLPQTSFGQFLQQSIIGGVASSTHNDRIVEPNYNPPLFFDGNSALFSSKVTPLQDIGNNRSRYWDYLDATSKARTKEVERDNELNRADKVGWMEMNNQHGLNHFQGSRGYNNNASTSSTNGAVYPCGGQQVFFPSPRSTSTFFPTTTRYPSCSATSLEAASHPRQGHSNFHNLFSSSSIKTFQLNNANPNKLILQHCQDEDNSSS